MLRKIGEIIAVKKDSLTLLSGKIVSFEKDKNYIVLHSVHEGNNYTAARVMKDKKELEVLTEDNKRVNFSDIYIAPYGT